MKLKRIIPFLLVLLLALTMLFACGKTNDEQTDDTENNEFKLEMPSKELQDKFVEEYSMYFHNSKYYNLVSIRYWLGSFGDVGFVYVFDGGLVYTQAEQIQVVADCRFEYPSGQTIQVWVDEKILSIKDAYEQELITKEMVEKIAEVWAQKQYIEV